MAFLKVKDLLLCATGLAPGQESFWVCTCRSTPIHTYMGVCWKIYPWLYQNRAINTLLMWQYLLLLFSIRQKSFPVLLAKCFNVDFACKNNTENLSPDFFGFSQTYMRVKRKEQSTFLQKQHLIIKYFLNNVIQKRQQCSKTFFLISSSFQINKYIKHT